MNCMMCIIGCWIDKLIHMWLITYWVNERGIIWILKEVKWGKAVKDVMSHWLYGDNWLCDSESILIGSNYETKLGELDELNIFIYIYIYIYIYILIGK